MSKYVTNSFKHMSFHDCFIVKTIADMGNLIVRFESINVDETHDLNDSEIPMATGEATVTLHGYHLKKVNNEVYNGEPIDIYGNEQYVDMTETQICRLMSSPDGMTKTDAPELNCIDDRIEGEAGFLLLRSTPFLVVNLVFVYNKVSIEWDTFEGPAFYA